MDNKKLFSQFTEAWKALEAANLDVEIVFEDGTQHKISDSVEIIWNYDNISLCWNPPM